MMGRSDKKTVEKVLAYILRGEELLVFRHVDYGFEQVGIQVPAGTMKPGESPEKAALREAREETGLADLTVVSKLGEGSYDISPLRMEIHSRHFFHLAVTGPVPERWASVELHEELVPPAPPTRLECFWIPLRYAHLLSLGQGALIGRLPQVTALLAEDAT
jgi:8-oxo-dGTP pyrophosphatase MutT (NUDIX family)